MNNNFLDKQGFVIKIGGSILSDGTNCKTGFFNFNKAEKLSKVFVKYTNKAYFVIGGGNINKWLLEHLKKNIPEVEINDQHYIGIAALNVNAELFRITLKNYLLQNLQNKGVDDKKIYEPVVRYKDLENFDFLKKVFEQNNYIVAGANKPGTSSDYDAVLVAQALGIKTILSLKNIDLVYTKDPNKYKDAKPIHDISWHSYLDLIKVKEHAPRANYPVDPIASKASKENNIKFIITNGNNIKNLEALFTGGNFIGTIIH